MAGIKRTLGLAVLGVICLAIAAQNAAAQGWVPYTGITRLGHVVTPPVRTLLKAPAHPGPPTEIPLRHRPSFVPSGQQSATPDPVLQTNSGPQLNAAIGAGFEGQGYNGYYPPDPNISVGGKDAAGHEEVVQTTNVEFAVYDAATGQLLSGPTQMDTLFGSLSGTLCASNNGGDPIVLWDKIAHRWLISQLAYTGNLRNDEVCIAISQNEDATGKYNAYGFSFSHLTDYPKFGVWSSSSANGTSDYYFSANLFSRAFYYGPLVCAFNGSDMQSGAAARAACEQGSTSDFSLLPSDFDGATPPAVGEPNYFVELGNRSSLTMFPFLAKWSSSGGSLNQPSGFSIPVASYSEACSNGGACIPQPGTSEQLDSLGDRLMYRLAFRNVGTYETLVVNHAVDEGNGVVGIRWYQIDSSGLTFQSGGTVAQQGTFGPDSNYRWMGSIAEDQVGDLALGYSISNGSGLYPSINVAGQEPNATPDTLGSETAILSGTGSETGSDRWGDYSSMSVDPADDCTFWYTNEYFPANAGSVEWSTYVAPFNFDDCPTFDLSAASSTASVTVGTAAKYTIDVNPYSTFSGTVSLSAENLSNGLSTGEIGFSSNSVSLSGGTSASVTVSVDTSSLDSGTYTFDVVGADKGVTNGAGGQLAKGVPLTLVVSGGGSTVTVSSLSFSPNPVTGGNSSTGTVTLSAPAPSGGATVALSSSDSSVASVPSSVTVGAGTSSANFDVTTSSVSSQSSVTITASYNGSSASATLTVNPASTTGGSFSLSASSPISVSPGGSTSDAVTVGSSGFSGSVSLSVSGLPKFAHGSFSVNPVSVPAGGSASSTLTVKTNRHVATGSYPLTITGTSGSLSSSTDVTLNVE